MATKLGGTGGLDSYEIEQDSNRSSRKFYEPYLFSSENDVDPESWIRKYELYSRKMKWDDSDRKDLMELYLAGKALRWYERTRDLVNTWDELKTRFLDKFEGQESEIRVWKQLQQIKQDNDEEVEEFACRIKKLLSKAKITEEEVKRKYLISALLPKYQRSVLKVKTKSFEEVILIASKEEELGKIIEPLDENIKSNSLITDRIKLSKISFDKVSKADEENQMYEALVKKFEELSVNLMSKIEKSGALDNKSRYSKEKQDLYNRGACFYCKEAGHKSNFCTKAPWSSKKTSERHFNSQNMEGKNVDCIQIESKENLDGSEEVSRAEVFSTEKRKSQGKPQTLNKKIAISDEKSVGETRLATKIRSHAIKKRSPEIELVNGISAYSIKNQLANSDANISLAQLLQVSPEIRYELNRLCKKAEDSSNINYIEKNPVVTNCKALVKIFGKRYWAIIDTGAACSVITKPLLEKLGIGADYNSNQVIITADGNRHSTYGHVVDVPIEISSYTFNADLLIMNQDKDVLILGVDWLKSHNGVVDIKNDELIFPKDNYEVVLSLSTQSIEKDFKYYNMDESEIFGIGKEVCEVEKITNIIFSQELEDFLLDNSDMLANDISELTQTDAIMHRIDTGLEDPIKLKPYRIPKSLKEEARVEIDKMKSYDKIK
ncbi:hypothetical protein AYI68_g6672 [Smittium mucronatum]|uniref:Retrotransposon gag domain-containing protein n=1 Tax=Smittium mucronatum TaxID=133383 RepID=A0A1R0GQU3_9FUNG|nr:hypothetical protein AYI68_g6672 [Smittium mucronatum]